jgi:hypothetical protein
VVRAVFPERSYHDPNCWPRARRLDSAALALVEDGAPPAGAEEAAIWLLAHLGAYRLVALREHSSWLPLLEKASVLLKRQSSNECREFVVMLSLAGDFLREIRGAENLEAARSHLTRALTSAEEALGPENRCVGNLLYGLVRVLVSLGEPENLSAARAHLPRAIAIAEKEAGRESSLGVPHLSNLAHVMKALGGQESLEAARSHLTRALAFQERAFGKVHPFLATTLSDLASVLADLGGEENLRQARENFVRAETILRMWVETEHPDSQEVAARFAAFRQQNGDA